MSTILEKEKKRQLRIFHTLLSRCMGNSEQRKEAILEAFGVDSSRDLDTHQLMEVIKLLESELDTQSRELDIWRKRLIASVGGWLKALNRDGDIRLIKAIACRASERKSFNDIPLDRLRSLYNAFSNKQKDLNTVERLTADELDYLSCYN